MVDIVIVRNNCDEATQITNWIGDGLADHIRQKGFTVTDLSGGDANPGNVDHWLNICNENLVKAAICFDHGSDDAFWGQQDSSLAKVITMDNVQLETFLIHVYTLACSTNAGGGLGEKAIDKGCYSWLGYTEPVYVTYADEFKACIWSYIDAMIDGKTIEECEQALRQAYQDRINMSWIYQYNLDRLKLRKRFDNMTINSQNRNSQANAGYATRVDVEYFFDTHQHCIWAVVDGKACYLWVDDEEAETILKLTAEATQVYVQYDGEGKIVQLRPVKGKH